MRRTQGGRGGPGEIGGQGGGQVDREEQVDKEAGGDETEEAGTNGKSK